MKTPDLNTLLELDEAALKKLTKAELIELSLCLQKELVAQINKHKQEQDDQIKKKINEEANKPSSKKSEWDKDGNPKTDSKKKQEPKKKRKKRPGCGNVSKSEVKPDKTNYTLIEECPDCGTDLNNSIGRKKKGRIVEDVEPPQMKTIVTEEVEEAKWCPGCKKMVSSKTEAALPGSDIGLNATIEMAYLWVMSALSLAKIQDILDSFQALTISTAGISKSMIRLSGILQPVYDEILNDVKLGVRIHADETGWRVKGKLWWLWIFANDRSAYYWPDRKRGGGVVERILGEVFLGILIVNGWHAYNKIVCDRQTCMAHIFRKIRGFIDAYPQYRSIMNFYLKLRKIIRDGESLQKARNSIGEIVFQQRLKVLQKRFDELLRWKKPNETLQEVIKKFRRQQAYILTFVEHDEAPHHNNYGEYIIKKGVIKRKMSGGSMSVEGVRAYACIQSIAMTCQLRKIPFHAFIKASLIQYIQTGKPMLLAEYEVIAMRRIKMAA